MTLWLDAHMSPLLASWIAEKFGCECFSFRSLGYLRASDRTVFLHARAKDAVIVSKDSDFVDLLRARGAPPKVLWVRCGNRSNEDMQDLLERSLGDALEILDTEDLVVIRDVS